MPWPADCPTSSCQVNSEFQAFKHIEVLPSGELARASQPLEATLGIHPTLLLRNALPYTMDVVIWQVHPLARAAPWRHACARRPFCVAVVGTHTWILVLKPGLRMWPVLSVSVQDLTGPAGSQALVGNPSLPASAAVEPPGALSRHPCLCLSAPISYRLVSSVAWLHSTGEGPAVRVPGMPHAGPCVKFEARSWCG